MTSATGALTELETGALLAVEKGLRVVPLHGLRERDGRLVCRCPLAGRCDTPGKHPIRTGWQVEATSDPDAALRLLRLYPEPNLGVLVGPLDDDWRLFCLDVDDRHGGHGSLARLESENAPLPETLRDERGQGGHRFYLAPASAKLRGGLDGFPGLELKGGGKPMCVVIPPSLHKSGDRRHWTSPEAHIAIAPDWLLELARKPVPVEGVGSDDPRDTRYGLAALKAACARVRAAQRGELDDTLNREIYSMGRLVAGGELREETARPALEAAVEDLIRAHPGCKERKAREKLARSYTDGLAAPRNAPDRSGGHSVRELWNHR